MDAPLYPPAELVLADEQGLGILGPPPGPAGISSVELPDRSTWQLDHAQPSAFTLIEAPSEVDPASLPLLVAAFGGDGALFAGERAQTVEPGSQREAELIDDEGPAPLRYGGPTRNILHPHAHRAGLAVLLADLASSSEEPLVRVAAALEFLATLPGNPAEQVLSVLAPVVAGQLELAASGVDDFDTDLLEQHDAVRLEGLTRQAGTTIRPGPALEELASRLAQHATVDMAALRHLDLVDRLESLILAAHAEPPSLSWQRAEEALVTATAMRSDDDRWLRVMSKELVLLGQAPVERDGLVDAASVVVPADVADEDLVVTLVAEADLDQGTRSPLDAVREAVAAGRAAARADRLDNRGDARERWQRCAELWETAEDWTRGEQAQQLAEVGTGYPPSDLLADRIAEEMQ